MMCSSLQQNQRTFKWPNANDVEAAEQSQDWTLDCTLLFNPLAAFHDSKSYLPSKHCCCMKVACFDVCDCAHTRVFCISFLHVFHRCCILL